MCVICILDSTKRLRLILCLPACTQVGLFCHEKLRSVLHKNFITCARRYPSYTLVCSMYILGIYNFERNVHVHMAGSSMRALSSCIQQNIIKASSSRQMHCTPRFDEIFLCVAHMRRIWWDPPALDPLL